MKIKTCSTCAAFFCLFTGAFAAQGSPLFTFNPPSGAISGIPGAQVGWGFTVTSDSSLYISVTSSILISQTNPSLGSYTDFIGAQGGPGLGFLVPNSSPWTETFDGVTQGVGLFTINTAAAIGAVDSGEIEIQYQTFQQPPNLCGSCSVGSGSVNLPFTVSVVPEPSTFLLALAPLAFWLTRRLRRP